jgi:3-dehydroquinate synthetase
LVPVVLHSLDQDVFHDLILHDKKAQKEAVNFIMLKKLGESFIQQEMPVEKLWDEFKKFTELHPEFVELR